MTVTVFFNHSLMQYCAIADNDTSGPFVIRISANKM